MALMLNISQQAPLSLWHLCFSLLSHHITGDLERQIKHKKRHKSLPCRPTYTSSSFLHLIFPSIETVYSVITNELTCVLRYCCRPLTHTSVFIYSWSVNSAHLKFFLSHLIVLLTVFSPFSLPIQSNKVRLTEISDMHIKDCQSFKINSVKRLMMWSLDCWSSDMSHH